VRSLALFLNLYLGHLLGDFALQPGRLVLAKRDGTPGVLLHTLIVGVCTAAVLAGTLSRQWQAAALVTLMHLVIERLTIVTYLKTPTRGLYTLLLDQTMHMLSIAFVVWISGGWSFEAQTVTFGIALPVTTLATLIAVLMVAAFGSILAFETANAFVESDDPKGRVLALDAPRLGGFAERGVAMAAALLLHPAALVVPFVPRGVWGITRRPGHRARPLVEAGAGLALCLIAYAFWALIRFLVANRGIPVTGLVPDAAVIRALLSRT
jgi:hypothetical protein